jgi:hypothetical protein
MVTMRGATLTVLLAFLLTAMPRIATPSPITPNATTPARRRAVAPPSHFTQPVATADLYSAGQGTTLTVPAPGVLSNDAPGGASIVSYGATTGAEQTTIGQSTPTTKSGSVTLNADGGFTYSPAAGFSGTDTFLYVLRNSVGSSTASVTITVAPLPVAADDMYLVAQNNVLTLQAPGVLGNDTLNGATISGYGATSGMEQTSLGNNTPTARGGVVALNAGGGFTYNPQSGFSGSDTFRYIIHNAVGSATATVTINVQAPVSDNADFTVTSPGFFYNFAGISESNPELTLVRGRTYRFQINTDFIHPFEILNAPAGSVTNNNISSGLLTFTVPNTAATYMYICSIHGFGNNINTTP